MKENDQKEKGIIDPIVEGLSSNAALFVAAAETSEQAKNAVKMIIKNYQEDGNTLTSKQISSITSEALKWLY